jgi:ribose 5-phosphate isomerase B
MTNNTIIFNNGLPIAIGSDHAGYAYKEMLVKLLESQNWLVADKGTHTEESCDYPDYAHAVAIAVETGAAALGILICGSGNGVCMAANKHPNIRAALCWNEEITALARSHNNANILCLPARFVSREEAIKMTELFLSVPFEGGRHQKRVDKI